jgi:hypothetical protein
MALTGRSVTLHLHWCHGWTDDPRLGRQRLDTCSRSYGELLPRSYASTALAIGEIDWAVQALMHHKQRLQVHLNAMAPIARLPPEVLSRIFDVFLHDGTGRLSH